MSDDDLGWDPRSFGLNPFSDARCERFRAVLVAIEHDQDAIAAAFLPQCQPHRFSQALLLDQIGTSFAERTIEHEIEGTALVLKPAQEYGYCLFIALSL